MKKLTDARNEILEYIDFLIDCETVKITEAYNRVIAEDIKAPFSVPPFDTSAMDGFAVMSSDFINGIDYENIGLTLNVIDEVAAGACCGKKVVSGTAVKIMTGAPLPEGADAILMKEYADEYFEQDAKNLVNIDSDCKNKKNAQVRDWKIIAHKKVASGLHIRNTGADFKKDDIVLKCGTRLNPAAVGICASAAKSEIKVYKKPNIAIVSTGDELIDPFSDAVKVSGFIPAPGKIMNSNSYMLGGLINECGALPFIAGAASDTPRAIAEKINYGISNADILITTGGASVGSYDYIPAALEMLGFKVNIWKMEIKPGRPFVFGVKEKHSGGRRKLVFGLPGNPASSLVSFIQFVKPAILKLCGAASPLAFNKIIGSLKHDIRMDSERITLLRARFYSEGGKVWIDFPTKQDSNILSSALTANCLAEIPAGAGIMSAGTEVCAQIL